MGDVTIPDDTLVCKVCYKVHVSPRIFPGCGHSMCGPCSVQVDREAPAPNAHTCRRYKCPFCRVTTIVPWFRRPRNHALESLAQHHPDYEERKTEVTEDATRIDTIPKDLDLAKLAQQARRDLAIECYTTLMPLLVEAANAGSCKLIVTESNLVRDIEKTSDLVSTLLFDHQIYKLQVNPGLKECTVSITPLAFGIRNTYTNPAMAPPPPPGLFQQATSEPNSTLLSGLLQRMRTSDDD